jgi:hypothetical protein
MGLVNFRCLRSCFSETRNTSSLNSEAAPVPEPLPILGIPKNKSQESDIFSTPKNTTQGTTTSPQKHHNFTTKNHQHPATFPTHPSKNSAKSPKSTLPAPTDFFSKKQKKNAAPKQ